MVRGGYWHDAPTASTKVVVAFAGVVAPEAIEAHRAMGDSAALLQVTSYDRLTNEWKAEGAACTPPALLAGVPRDAARHRHRRPPDARVRRRPRPPRHAARRLRVAGVTGDLVDLYRHYGIDADAIVRACADNVQY